MRRVSVMACCAAAGVFAATGPAAADILLNISKTSQRMSVLVDGSARYIWTISTGRGRYVTPNGVFQPTWMARKWRSRQYQNAPMPYSIFFHRGYAIHGTTEISRLGRPASHGCVRLHPKDAAVLFDLVKNHKAQTHIVVSNDVIEAPGAPKPKPQPSPFVAEIDTTDDPVLAAGGTKVDDRILAAEIEVATKVEAEKAPVAAQPSVPESPREAAKTDHSPAVETAATRPQAQAPARPARVKTAVRARADTQPGFHW